MTTDNYACNSRNPFPGTMFFIPDMDVYRSDIEIDYKDEDVSPQAILNLFRGRYPPNVSLSREVVS